eukprot:COSAG01_NODE_52484_length_346_cov_1.020243_1_plen_48_part_01
MNTHMKPFAPQAADWVGSTGRAVEAEKAHQAQLRSERRRRRVRVGAHA